MFSAHCICLHCCRLLKSSNAYNYKDIGNVGHSDSSVLDFSLFNSKHSKIN